DFVMKHNIPALEKKMQEKLKKFPDLKKRILRDIGAYMMRETKKRFDNQVSPDGKPWKPISKLTANRRRKGKGSVASGHKALLDTGAGKLSITYELVGSDGVKIGPGNPSDVFYLAFHQSGFRSKITRRQSWWMVFNLYGFDSKRPSEFVDGEATPSGGWLGWHAARNLARTLEGSTLEVPQRAFAGISRTNADEINNILRMHLSKP
ncbi:unnamed protein product, partial [marine sediment metagenome]